MLEVFFHAVEDLDTERGRPLQPRNAAPLESHFSHLLATDPRSCYLAEAHGQAIAFGIVMRRGADAFLSFLFVEPSWQGHQLGRTVLDACLRGAGAGLERTATCAEANQPVSTGLYARLGMAPRVPIYLLRGSLPDEALPELPAGVQCRPLAADRVAVFDRQLLGYERPQDHGWWARERQGVCFCDDAGTVLGYGYAHPSGRIGPVAALDPATLPGFVGYLVRLTSVLEGRQLVVPGVAISALQPLLVAGLRIDGTPAVYCSEGSAPAFERYLPMSFALL
ncbi:MAG: GNAT family N-acetyltransferase [Chloroflexota bacterium]|jgi:GNAT superfamily N-acetyltransferase